MKRFYPVLLVSAGLVILSGCFGAGALSGFTITYDGNGSDAGSVPTDATAYEANAIATVAEKGTLARSGSAFLYWNTAANGSGETYWPGDTLTVNADVTLYAQWEAQGTAVWANTSVAGATGFPAFLAVDSDASGNVYAVGFVETGLTHTFSPGVTVTGANSGQNPVIVKFDRAGQAVWARSTTAGSSDALFHDVSVSDNGDVVVAGRVTGTAEVSFGPTVTAQATNGFSQLNALVVVYDANGVAQWAKAIETASESSEFGGVATDSAGNVYTVGYITGSGTFDFGNGVTAASAKASGTNPNALIVKYSAAGVAQWAVTTQEGAGTNGTIDDESRFYDVAVNDNGVLAAGYQRGTTSFKYGTGTTDISIEGTATVTSDLNAVLVRFDASDGSSLSGYASQGSTNYSAYFDVEAGADGSVYAVGSQVGNGTFTYGGQSATSSLNDESPVIVNHTSNGTAQWARTLTGTSAVVNSPFATFYGVDVGSDGDITAVGSAFTSTTFEFATGVSAAGRAPDLANPLVVTYDSSGNALWAASNTSGAVEGFFEGITVTPFDRIVTAGFHEGTASYSFGPDASVTGSSANTNATVAAFVK